MVKKYNSNWCGKKFEFGEADNIYSATCNKDELCPECQQDAFHAPKEDSE